MNQWQHLTLWSFPANGGNVGVSGHMRASLEAAARDPFGVIREPLFVSKSGRSPSAAERRDQEHSNLRARPESVRLSARVKVRGVFSSCEG